MSNNREKLFTEFEAPTTQEWLDRDWFGEPMKASPYRRSIAGKMSRN